MFWFLVTQVTPEFTNSIYSCISPSKNKWWREFVLAVERTQCPGPVKNTGETDQCESGPKELQVFRT